MANNPLDKVMRHLRMVAAVHAYKGLSDRDLLDRFVRNNDDAAFTAMIDRYGPMLLGVCRRALGNLHDAEDVCQAALLVLARKAGSIRKSTSLANWLHGVGCRSAAAYQRAEARRRRREQAALPAPPKDAAAEVSWREIQSILDEELERLPVRYRAPLILCYLDGKTRDEAAGRLGLAPAALHGRLERGRNLLRERLTRRGLTLSAALFATALGESTLRAALPASFIISSTKAAMAVTAGLPAAETAVSASVLTLTSEVIKAMFMTKLKMTAALALSACLLGAATFGGFTGVGIAQDREKKTEVPARPAAKGEDDEAFLRRASIDLRGKEPTPTEVHFFVTSKDAGRRQKVIDLMIEERQASRTVDIEVEGTLVPIKRARLYSSYEGVVMEILPGLKTGDRVSKDQVLLKIHSQDLAAKILQLQGEIAACENIVRRAGQADPDKAKDPAALKEVSEAKITLQFKSKLLENLRKQNNSLQKPEEFAVKSPINGIVLSPDFREYLQNKNVRPNDPLLRIGDVDPASPKASEWEVETVIPQKYAAKVLGAFSSKDPKAELDVDVLLTTAPTRLFKGKLAKSKIAYPDRFVNNEPEPGIMAWVRLSGPDIPEASRISADLLLVGTEVRVRIRSQAGQKK